MNDNLSSQNIYLLSFIYLDFKANSSGQAQNYFYFCKDFLPILKFYEYYNYWEQINDSKKQDSKITIISNIKPIYKYIC